VIEPFVVEIPEQFLRDLRERIAVTRWPAAIGQDGWEAGAALSYMRPLLDHWQSGFDWRACERRLNAFAQFRTAIDGHHIHFIHERGKGPRPFPIVITHGWPGMVLELLPLIPLLADPASHGGDAEDAFDVVAPSIPGYGFSTLAGAGVNAFRIGELWAELMTRLGYSRFGAQGGDWGASVSTCLGLRSPDRVAGIHLNYIPGSYRPHLDANSRPLSAAETAFQLSQNEWAQSEGGYAAIQRTRPQTLGYALNDSPVGLAAWIAEKLRAWTDCDGNLDRCFSKDDVLAIVTLYWVTQSMPSAVRLYFEMRKRPMHFQAGERVNVPCGIARFAKEAPFPPRDWIERGYHVVRWSEFPSGGHYPAWEQPEVMARDIREFFRPLRGHR
jgi:pimeloyl-ACP methyl ester carboxylesterase